MAKTKLIDLMIVGAQKAGTTGLLRYLGLHPKICVHERPEFSFFDLNEQYQKGYDWAFNHYFNNCKNLSDKMLFAKNVEIMYSESALKRLRQFNPDINLIILLRNPVERVYSAYWYARREAWEPLKTFEEAIKAEKERLNDNPFKWRQCAYISRSLYYEHIKLIYKFFPSEQVHIFLFDDFKRNPKSIISQVLSLFNLELGDYFDTTLGKVNKSAIARSTFLVNLVNSDNAVKRFFKSILPTSITYKVGKKIKEMAQKEFEYPPMRPETRRFLIDYFKEPNKKLSMLINMDLSKWNE